MKFRSQAGGRTCKFSLCMDWRPRQNQRGYMKTWRLLFWRGSTSLLTPNARCFCVVLSQHRTIHTPPFSKRLKKISVTPEEHCTPNLAKAWIVVNLYLYVLYRCHCFVVEEMALIFHNPCWKKIALNISFFQSQGSHTMAGSLKTPGKIEVLVALLWWYLQMWFY